MMTERFENDRLYSSVAVYCVYPNQSMNLVQRGEGVSMLSFIFVLAFSVTTAFLSILRKVRDCLNNQMFEKYVFCKMATRKRLDYADVVLERMRYKEGQRAGEIMH